MTACSRFGSLLDEDTRNLVRQAEPVIRATLGAFKPDDVVLRDADGAIEYHFHAPIIINIGYNAECHLGDAALRERGW